MRPNARSRAVYRCDECTIYAAAGLTISVTRAASICRRCVSPRLYRRTMHVHGAGPTTEKRKKNGQPILVKGHVIKRTDGRSGGKGGGGGERKRDKWNGYAKNVYRARGRRGGTMCARSRSETFSVRPTTSAFIYITLWVLAAADDKSRFWFSRFFFWFDEKTKQTSTHQRTLKDPSFQDEISGEGGIFYTL